MALDIAKIKAEYENVVPHPAVYEKPTDWREIRLACRDYRNDWLEKAKWKETQYGTMEQVNDAPKRLTELAVAEGLEQILYVINLPNDRVAVYDPDAGYYHKDPSFAYKVIRLLEPTFTETRSKNVLFMLAATKRKYLYDGFSCDFSIGDYQDPKRFILVKNGIFDKQLKKMSGFTHRFVAFSTIETEYDPFAESPNINGWDVDSWLLDLMSGDEDLVHLLWQVISASLNGNYSYRKSIWFVGEGNDGKGTVQQLITNIVGIRNVATLKLNQFSERFALSMIEGKTVIIGDDVQAGVYIDESSNFNSVVTGEPVLVEEKNKQPYSTVFKKTVIQSTNELPRFKNKTNGTYRRFLIIPFRKTFSAKEDNWQIKDEYINRDDVKQYVLKKALELNFTRFSEPQATLDVLEEFKSSNDTVKAFIDEWFGTFQSERLPVRFLWWLYQEWCKEEGITKVAKGKFERQLIKLLPEEWEKKRAKPTRRFKPSLDVPRRYTGFYWDNDNDPNTTAVCLDKKLLVTD
ncbi:TPA: phage/plasmid primase, P4 family [Streptococcus suis]